MYRVHSIRVKNEDFERADAIVLEHLRCGDIDALRYCEDTHQGARYTTFWMNLIISDDLEVIKNEFREKGIQMF